MDPTTNDILNCLPAKSEIDVLNSSKEDDANVLGLTDKTAIDGNATIRIHNNYGKDGREEGEGPCCSFSNLSESAPAHRQEGAIEEVFPPEISSLLDELLNQTPTPFDVIGHSAYAECDLRRQQDENAQIKQQKNAEEFARREYRLLELEKRPHSVPAYLQDCSTSKKDYLVKGPESVKLQCIRISSPAVPVVKPNECEKELVETVTSDEEEIVELIQPTATVVGSHGKRTSRECSILSSHRSTSSSIVNVKGNSSRLTPDSFAASAPSIGGGSSPVHSVKQRDDIGGTTTICAQRHGVGASNGNVEAANVERCAIDPITNRRFYEPHNKPGCEYCLSQVTQIGERICSVENKLTELTELFHQLVKQRVGGEDIANQPTTSAAKQPQLAHFVNATNPISSNNGTGHSFAARTPVIISKAPRIEKCNSERFQSYSNPTKILPTNGVRIIPSSTVYNNNNRSNVQKIYKFPISRLSATGVSDQEPSKSSKTLAYGIRIYYPKGGIFIGEKNCPVCFAHFETAVSLNSHILRHRNEKIAIEFYRCNFCRGPLFVHFLSAQALREHILNLHGVTNEQMVQTSTFYDPRGSKPLIQTELRNFVRAQLVKWDKQLKNAFGYFTEPTTTASLNSAQKRRRGREEECEEEQYDVDHILFRSNPAGLPRNLADRYQQLRNLSRASSDKMVVSIDPEQMFGRQQLKLANTMAGIDELEGADIGEALKRYESSKNGDRRIEKTNDGSGEQRTSICRILIPSQSHIG